ncbi:ZIP family metal transporter [Heliobacterium undosum]|uniref:ZIP family metal transporter n=1 Tax=Heliomicrobium undosum TaxID=121734 RepID=A0A845L5N4_9FIRM|nr:ZIP family metal transporter [Heliomicrobium undosum]MZP28241.1 ZIP family metal transporter [Heliomicrobium undosum]
MTDLLPGLIWPILGISLIAGLATTGGALCVLMLGSLGARTLSVLLGFAAGVMLSVVALDLLPSAWNWGGPWSVVTGFCLGALLIALCDVLLTQFALSSKRGRQAGPLRKMGYLIALGISLHDFPEGIAIAAGTAAESHLGWVVALSIGLHNIPEGVATAAPLRMSGMAPWKIIGLTMVMAFFTPLGTLLGFGLLALSTKSIAQLLALAGGAMVYLVWDELWPEASKRSPHWAFTGAIVGALGMAALSGMHH